MGWLIFDVTVSEAENPLKTEFFLHKHATRPTNSKWPATTILSPNTSDLMLISLRRLYTSTQVRLLQPLFSRSRKPRVTIHGFGSAVTLDSHIVSQYPSPEYY